eukprot:scaffold222129_cov57-Attheya_sp.AAC.2
MEPITKIIPQAFLLELLVSGLIWMPLGCMVGFVVERIACRHALKYVIRSASLWNAMVRFAAAYVTSIYLENGFLSLLQNDWDHCMDCYSIQSVVDIFKLLKHIFWCKANDETPSNNDGDVTRQLVFVMVVFMIRLLGVTLGATIGGRVQIVGLTGGIACGKSTVAQVLREGSHNNNKPSPDAESHKQSTATTTTAVVNKEQTIQFTIIDVDKIAHDIVEPGGAAYHNIVKEFGTDILVNNKGTNAAAAGESDTNHNNCPMIDRRALGDIVFSDDRKRRKLNKLTHPKIIQIMLRRMVWESLFPKADAVCVDIPLLFEGGFIVRMLFSVVIVVAADPDIQLQRLKTRNRDLTEDQCRKRIASQMDVCKKAEMADICIHNNGSMKQLHHDIHQAATSTFHCISGWGISFAVMTSILSFRFILAALFFIFNNN